MSDVMEPNEPTTEPESYPPVPAAVADSRFLFVDVAAQRAKQLRRGALPRLQPADVDPQEPSSIRELPHKLERVAMEEIRRGLVPTIAPPLGDDSDEGA